LVPQNRPGSCRVRFQRATQPSPVPDALASSKPIFITAGGGFSVQFLDSTMTRPTLGGWSRRGQAEKAMQGSTMATER